MAKAKTIPVIDCEAAAAEAIRVVLVTRLEEMSALRDHALDWSDPEGVHDMRVSSRRLRGALRDFAPYLHKHGLSATLKEIRKIADALGDVRDQDVAIIGLQKLETGAPVEAAAMLERLVQAREIVRKRARKDLQQSLNKRPLKQLQTDFVAAVSLATGNSKPPKRAQANVTYRDVARSIIRERLKEVEDLSQGLYRPLRMKPLHKMRIAAKRLRYALELFEPCWGAGIREYAKRVAALQASLGELHDSNIWIETFGEQLNGIKSQPKNRADAALWLLSHFVKLHSKHLRNSLERWRDWEVNECGSRLRECLNESSLVAVELVPPVPEKTEAASENHVHVEA
jgi:CHAD domain-containing protein